MKILAIVTLTWKTWVMSGQTWQHRQSSSDCYWSWERLRCPSLTLFLHACCIDVDRSLTTLSQTWINNLLTLWRTHDSICAECHMLVGTRTNSLGAHTHDPSRPDVYTTTHSCLHKHTHHHIKITALWVPMQDNNSSSSLVFSLNCLQFFFTPSVHLSPSLAPSLPSFFSFVSYCLPAVLISAPLIFQPMNWSHWLYHSHCQLQPSLIYVPFFSLSSSLSLSTVPLTGM